MKWTLVVAACCSACATASIQQQSRGAPAFAALQENLETDPHRDLKGLLVIRDGAVVTERYFNGADRQTLHDVRSAGKSVTSALVGIAIDQRLIAGVEARAFTLIDHGARTGGPNLHDVLTMRSGLAADDQDPASPGNEERMDASESWVAFVTGLPTASPPGTKYVYNSATAFLAGAAVEGAAGERLDSFAAQHLFGPLGITRYEWRVGPDGRTAGQGNLRLTLRDFGKIGELFLNGGTYHGRRIISRSWVDASLAPHVPISSYDLYADHYGYMWYSKTYSIRASRVLVHFASGNGGNKVYIVPSLNSVIAIMSSAYGQGRGQKRSEHILLSVLDELSSMETTSPN